MLGHLSLPVRDLDRAQAFYDAALGAIGVVQVWRSAAGLGYGPPGGEDRLALFCNPEPDLRLPAARGFHLAFDAPDRAAVDAFHVAALAHGGVDQGAPGLRPRYSPTYYAAFVLDPDGHKLEVVFQGAV